jgi:hypothetical protein
MSLLGTFAGVEEDVGGSCQVTGARPDKRAPRVRPEAR